MANEMSSPEQKVLLERHRRHKGIYSRIAAKLGVDASYVSRVASGDRKSTKIERALIGELQRIELSLRTFKR